MFTERSTITLEQNGVTVVMDIVPDGGPNPWGIYLDTLDPETGELNLDSGPASHCNDYCLDECNPDTLFEYWFPYAESMSK